MEVNASINGYKKSNLSGFSEKTNVAAKRISLKALTSFNEASHHISVFESVWPKLKRATIAVFQNAPVEYTLEELYRYVEDVCAQKMLIDLYSDLKLLMQDFVEGLLPIFIKYPFHLVVPYISHIWTVLFASFFWFSPESTITFLAFRFCTS
ncbi:hypothetical protein EG68_08001 [Paragonimus skrjabini miyazakii]|uniref:Cullin N-terminal domain-containing protein n=1 Tax=Paragonimus skrjabini miyazakii TaxID=59628 RepID=A0A8S9Y9D6_9TREM|nr:hypothetical protein EG68_08001 [Paragonimus skrjabini miyazakii]